MPIRTTPFPPRPQRFGDEEIDAIKTALAKNSVWYWQPHSVVQQSVDVAAREFGAKYAVATSSGTASIHVAVAASRIRPGSEVITTPITDMGTINAILYQNLIPVFADVDPNSAGLTVDTIRSAMTDWTRAVVVVHLTGCPVDIGPIASFCKERRLILIEDCAQALGATYNGQHVGTFGDFGCYSLNDQKHVTSGEGGFILVESEELFYLCHNYADKYHDREKRGVFLQALAPNYRMSEIDGAMFLAQFPKLGPIVSKRRMLGRSLTRQLKEIPGIIPQTLPAGSEESYFFYLFRIDPNQITMPRDRFIELLRAEGIPASGAYVAMPFYRAPYFRNKSFFPDGIWPAEIVSGRAYDYNVVDLPGAELAVATGISLPLNEGYADADISDYVAAIRKVAQMEP
jgi:dTDP-4-amino-4,6-dideoxygalactose transaminase